MRTITLALSSTLALFAATIGAMTTPASAQTSMMVGSAAPATLRTGTPISLRMSEELTTQGKSLRSGYRFRMEVADPIMLNGRTVIPAGSPATGEVTEVRNKGMWGKSGRINARLLYVQVDGRQIRLSGQLDDKGSTGTAGVVGAVAFVPVAGFFVTGTSAKIPVGAPVHGFVDEDVPVSFAMAAPQGMPLAAR